MEIWTFSFAHYNSFLHWRLHEIYDTASEFVQTKRLRRAFETQFLLNVIARYFGEACMCLRKCVLFAYEILLLSYYSCSYQAKQGLGFDAQVQKTKMKINYVPSSEHLALVSLFHTRTQTLLLGNLWKRSLGASCCAARMFENGDMF